MEGFMCLLVVLGVAAFLCGPIALIVAITAHNKTTDIERRLRAQTPTKIETPPRMEVPLIAAKPETPIEEPQVTIEETAGPQARPPLHFPQPQESPPPEPVTIPPSPQETARGEFAEQVKKTLAAEKLSLEVFLGTRALAIVGSIAVLAGVIFGLKYLYDMKLITELGRTLIVAGGGIVALVIGQITRRRGYEIVATALAALGFAMLYAADFAAFGFYHIIGTNPAFGLAVVITACGMLYAVRVNEIIVAVLSLLGGFLSPVILSSGENRPNTLFGYVLILIGGAMACAAVRKWRWVSRLSFVGTVLLYAGWFSEWFEPAMFGNAIPEQLPVAVSWLCVFFVIYLIMPVLYELLKRQAAHTGDVLLIAANAAFCYAYLYQILAPHHRPYLALAAVCLGAAHFAMMWIVHSRTPHDTALKLSFLALGLFFITVAIPLYLKMYAVALAWAGEGAILSFVALRYRSKITQLASFAALLLAVFTLAKHLPLHQREFALIFNNTFGSWCFVAAAFYIAHLFYRRQKEGLTLSSRASAQILYCFSLALLLTASCWEWFAYTDYNLVIPSHTIYIKGLLVILATFAILYVIPLLRPAGALPFAISCILAIITFVAVLVFINSFYKEPFTFIFNSSLAATAYAGLALYATHLLYRCAKDRELSVDESSYLAQIIFCISLIALLAAALMEWYGHTRYNLIPTTDNLYAKWFIKGAVIVCSAFVILFLMPVFRPAGVLPVITATVLALVTSVGTLAVFPDFYGGRFTIFANAPFAIGLAPLAALAIGAILLKRDKAFQTAVKNTAYGYGLGIIFFLWMLLTEQIYLYWNYPGRASFRAGINLGQMWISIMWAIYAAAVITVGLWRKLITLRYIGFCFFTIVLIKVFIFDMSTLEKVYRIAGFIVLGLVLIGVSYLYQYLRKTGFFEKSLSA